MENELQTLILPRNPLKSIPPEYPYHLMNLDDPDSLNVILNFKDDDWYWNYKCEAPNTKSFKVFLHRPDEMKGNKFISNVHHSKLFACVEIMVDDEIT